MRDLARRLKERRLVQWALAYLAGAWLALQVLGFLSETFAWRPVFLRSITVVLGVGLLAVLIVAWYHGEKGAQRMSGVEALLLAGVLLIAGGAVALVRQDAEPSDASAGAFAEPAAEQGSIAVLPFVDMSPEADQEYFGDGMTEELLNALAQVQGLRVAARTSSFAFKGKNEDVRRIANELGVESVVEGSVRKSGNRLRVAVQLIQASTGYRLWSETYDRELSDVFTIQEEIARSIVTALELRLPAHAGARLVRGSTADVEAHTLYLKGRFFWNKRTPEALQQAIDHFEQAIARDSSYARAYAGLADTYVTLYDYGILPAEQATTQARAAAQRALEIDASLAEAHTSLAHINLHDWNWEAAEQEFKRAIELDPSYASAYHWYALSLTAVGRLDEAVAVMERAQKLDPLSLRINTDLGMAFLAARRPDAAVEQERKTLEMEPDFPVPYWIIGMAYEQSGRFDEAIRAFEDALERNPNSPNFQAALAHAYARSGREQEARRLLAGLEARARENGVSPFFIALVYAGLNQNDAAFEWLDRAVDQRSGSVRYLKIEPRLDNLRADPRFGRLLRRAKLPV